MGEHRLRVYEGHDVDVTFDGRLCIHMGECGRARGPLFQRGREPWCAPDLVPLDTLVEIVDRCPSGALAYARKDGVTERAPPENVVTVSHRGPLFLRGDLRIEGAADDMDGVRHRAALCRCGVSDRKPFCDGKHEEIDWADAGAIGVGSNLASEASAPLVIKRVKNGPLVLEGPHTLIAGSGRVATRAQRSVLCRCGQSSQKPFCDGSHKAGGFQAE